METLIAPERRTRLSPLMPEQRSGPGLIPTQGLSESEVVSRRAAGQGNDVAFAPSRTYRQIIRDNALSSINIIIFGIGLTMIMMGLLIDALSTLGLVTLNIVIAAIQEGRAKRVLDRLALLTRPMATVIRDGRERAVDQAEIVLGDLLVIEPGDQVVADGRLVDDGGLEIDESLLTGESDPVKKEIGDQVLSGSFCVSGRGVYEAVHVGAESLANRLTASARAFRQVKTPIQREVDLVLRIMLLLIFAIGGPIILDLAIRAVAFLADTTNAPFAETLNRAYQGYSLEESVRSIAVVVGLVPQGLALMLTVTYAVGAVRLVRHRALLQQANAVESLSHVDVLCLDKTGTLTTNRLTYHARHQYAVSDEELTRLLGDFTISASAKNKTSNAISAAFPGQRRELHDEVAFSSELKWSGLSFAEGTYPTLVLGAPDVLAPSLRSAAEIDAQLTAWTAEGLRVVLLAGLPKAQSFHGSDGEPVLPTGLIPLGLVSLRDELQPGVSETIRQFAENGIAIKIISGDHPNTVATLARQAGIGDGQSLTTLSGRDLTEMDDSELARAAKQVTIFGRITPQQKLDLIRVLQADGRYVAMIGDGVNDVLALKQAQVGIAMESGSQATRAVADLVLRDDSFAALPAAFREGQRIVRGIQDLIKLYLARSLAVALAIMGAGAVGVSFPVVPRNNSIPAFLVVGVPTLFLAIWARAGKSSRDLLSSIVPFVVPATLTTAALEVTLYISYLRATSDVNLARTVQTAVAVLCGLILIVFVEPPNEWWAAGDEDSHDWRPTALAGLMAVVFCLVMYLPGLRSFFDLATLAPIDLILIAAAVGGWTFALRYIWRHDLLNRFLG